MEKKRNRFRFMNRRNKKKFIASLFKNNENCKKTKSYLDYEYDYTYDDSFRNKKET